MTTTLHAWHEPTHAGSIVWETKFVSESYSECVDWGKKHGIRRPSGVVAGEAYKMGESDIAWVKTNHPEWLPTEPTPASYTYTKPEFDKVCEAIKLFQSIQASASKCSQQYQTEIALALANMRKVKQGL